MPFISDEVVGVFTSLYSLYFHVLDHENIDLSDFFSRGKNIEISKFLPPNPDLFPILVTLAIISSELYLTPFDVIDMYRNAKLPLNDFYKYISDDLHKEISFQLQSNFQPKAIITEEYVSKKIGIIKEIINKTSYKDDLSALLPQQSPEVNYLKYLFIGFRVLIRFQYYFDWFKHLWAKYVLCCSVIDMRKAPNLTLICSIILRCIDFDYNWITNDLFAKYDTELKQKNLLDESMRTTIAFLPSRFRPPLDVSEMQDVIENDQVNDFIDFIRTTTLCDKNVRLKIKHDYNLDLNHNLSRAILSGNYNDELDSTKQAFCQNYKLVKFDGIKKIEPADIDDIVFSLSDDVLQDVFHVFEDVGTMPKGKQKENFCTATEPLFFLNFFGRILSFKPQHYRNIYHSFKKKSFIAESALIDNALEQYKIFTTLVVGKKVDVTNTPRE